MDLSGRCVLVTGASSGIGAACARAFAHLGCRLVLAARRRDRLDALAGELRDQHSSQVHTVTLDVRDRGAVEAMVASLPEPFDRIEVLVNNAGLSRGLSPLHQGLVSDWEEMLDTNVKGLLYVTRVVAQGMVARGRGHIITIGSIAGHETYPGGNVYCASKHAVTALTRGLAQDLLGTGVRVSSVDPGLVETEFSLVRFHGDAERAKAPYQGMTPLTAEDVGEAVVFCATRPAHVTVREMVLLPAEQASAVHVNRRAAE